MALEDLPDLKIGSSMSAVVKSLQNILWEDGDHFSTALDNR
jgi:hypothetical protein